MLYLVLMNRSEERFKQKIQEWKWFKYKKHYDRRPSGAVINTNPARLAIAARYETLKNGPSTSLTLQPLQSPTVHCGLRDARTFILWAREQWLRDRTTKYGYAADYTFIDKFLNGIRLISRQSTNAGFLQLQAGCDMLTRFIQERPLTVFLQLIEFYVEDRWDTWTDLRTSLVKHIIGMVHAECRQPNHPFHPTLRQLESPEVFKSFLPQLLRMLLIELECDAITDTRGKAFLKAEVAWKFCDLGLLDEARLTALEILREFGQIPDIIVSAYRCLGAVSHIQGDIEGALQHSILASQVCRANSQNFLIQEESIRLLKDRGAQEKTRGRLHESSYFHWKAFLGATQLAAFQDSEVLVFLQDLRNSLWFAGDFAGQARLVREYSTLYNQAIRTACFPKDPVSLQRTQAACARTEPFEVR